MSICPSLVLTLFSVFSRKDYTGPVMKDLVEIIEYVKPTALLGLSTIKGAFNEAVITKMSSLNPRPIIFPLSNPVRLSECEFHEAVAWSDGQVIFASGSPFPEQAHNGRTLYPGQGNNMYVFPGIGLGAILARVSAVTDSMIEAASLGLANSLTEEERALDLIYPRIERIRDISSKIALSVIRDAQNKVCLAIRLRVYGCADGFAARRRPFPRPPCDEGRGARRSHQGEDVEPLSCFRS